MTTHTKTTTLAKLLVPFVALVLLAGCGSSSSNSTKSTTAPASSGASTSSGATTSSPAITIKGFAFNPKTVTVKAGTKVTWTNKDSATHTATSDNGAFDTKSIKPGSSASFTFTKAGTYTYHCSIHPTMTATIVVT